MSAATMSLVATLFGSSRKKVPSQHYQPSSNMTDGRGTAAGIAQLIEKTPLFRAGDERQFGSKSRSKVTRLGDLDSHMISTA